MKVSGKCSPRTSGNPRLATTGLSETVQLAHIWGKEVAPPHFCSCGFPHNTVVTVCKGDIVTGIGSAGMLPSLPFAKMVGWFVQSEKCQVLFQSEKKRNSLLLKICSLEASSNEISKLKVN